MIFRLSRKKIFHNINARRSEKFSHLQNPFSSPHN